MPGPQSGITTVWTPDECWFNEEIDEMLPRGASLEGSQRRVGAWERRRRSPSDGQPLLKTLEQWEGMAKFKASSIGIRSKQVWGTVDNSAQDLDLCLKSKHISAELIRLRVQNTGLMESMQNYPCISQLSRFPESPLLTIWGR